MKKVFKSIISLICILTFGSVASFANESTYRLGAEDVVSVTVFNEPDLSLEKVKVNDDGKISVPLLGQVLVSNKTVAEVEIHINELFAADYLVNPKVTVTIEEFRPFYINGEVSKPGSYPFRSGITVEMAITIAGGFTERASKEKIFLVREDGNERVQVNLKNTVYPGDIITVEESFF